MENSIKHQSTSKKIGPMIAITVIMTIVIVGLIIYFVLSKSTKEKVFTAEKNVIEKVNGYFANKYEPELNWKEAMLKNPTKVDYSLSMNDNNMFGYTDPTLSSIINNSTLNIQQETDFEKRIANYNLDLNFGPLQFNDLLFSITNKEIATNLFSNDEVWVIKEEDLHNFLQKNYAQPINEDQLSLNNLFEQNHLSEEDITYIEKEYIELIYNMISDEAFISEKESIEVNGKKLKTEAIHMYLAENSVKDIIQKVVGKAKNDEKLIEIVSKMFSSNKFSLQAFIMEMQDEFDITFEEFLEGIENIDMPNGIRTTTWIHKGEIVKRDFHTTIANDFEDLSIRLTGEQLIDLNQLFMDYDLNVRDSYGHHHFNFYINSLFNDEKGKDIIEISLPEDVKINYKGDEALKDRKRSYKRIFTLIEDNQETSSVTWDGHAEYKKDSMESSNRITGYDGNGNIEMNIEKSGKFIDSIKPLDTKDAIDMSEMDLFELEMYLEENIFPGINGYSF